ncbi:murein biosynthesis integral membrane protein MurJ [candidate division NPL-UPA2 bacterium]|nr:murein biosynthesis integral membrane protein MurJ [candidate division NPL-UPA2 bacterium]
MRTSGEERLARSAGGIGLATQASRILGLLRDILIASHFGTGIYATVFIAAFRIPNLFRRLLGEGALSVSFIPIFTDYLTKSKEDAWRMAIVIFNLLAITLAGLTLLGSLGAPLWARLILSRFSLEHQEMMGRILRIIFPYIFLIGLAALAGSILNSFNHFAVPALFPAILNLSMITALLFRVKPESEEGIRTLALAVLIGGLGQILIQVPVLIRKGMPLKYQRSNTVKQCWPKAGIKDQRYHPLRHPAVNRIIGLMGPAVVGVAVYQINILVDTIICGRFKSIVGEEAIASLYFGSRLMQYPLAIFATAMATVVFPTMADQVSRERMEELKTTLLFALRWVFFLIIPSSIGLIVLRSQIISLIFERGAFGLASTQSSASALLYYSIGLFAYAGVLITNRVFYSLQDMKTPVKIGCVAMVLNIILNLVLMHPLRLGGLALATSLSALINLSLLLYVLSRRIGGVNGKAIFNCLLRITSASLFMGLVCYLVAGALMVEPGTASTTQKCLQVFIPILAGIITFLLISFSFRFEEAKFLKGLLFKRLSKH